MTRVLPRHTSCLEGEDYLAFLGLGGGRAPSLEEIWGERLPGGRLVPTPTGRHALWAFLRQANLHPGDEVLVAAYNYFPVVQILVQQGLEPVFVDVEPGTLCLDPDRLEERATDRCRMVLVTHMFGHPADLARITGFCRDRGLLLFEDCAHAPGTLCEGSQVGAAGDASLFSFGIYKILNTLGGGMLFVRSPLADHWDGGPAESGGALRARVDATVRLVVTLLMTPGLYGRLLHPLMRRTRLGRVLDPSDNDPDYRFDPAARGPFLPFMAAMLARQVTRLEQNVARRRALASRLRSLLEDVPGLDWLDPDRHGRSNASYLGVRTSRAREVARLLESRGVAARVGEFLDCSRLPQFRRWAADCPASREAEEEVLRLPSYPCMPEPDLARAADALRAAVLRGGS